jgi:hypothetical protein
MRQGMMRVILPALRESGLAGVFFTSRGSPAYFVATPPSCDLHRPAELLRMCPRSIRKHNLGRPPDVPFRWIGKLDYRAIQDPTDYNR